MADSITSGGFYFPAMYPLPLPGAAQLPYKEMTITQSNAVAFIGRMFWRDRSASKIVSSAGGRIQFRTGAVSVWTALSTLGIGIQDVDLTAGPPARPDGAFDVSTSITSSTITLTANHWHDFAMTSGTKTLSHGELYAVVFRMGTRVSTDAASIAGINEIGSSAEPTTSTLSAGTAWSATNACPSCIIQGDDGVFGWLHGGIPMSSISSQSISSGSTNDEVGLRFALPWTSEVCGLAISVQQAVSGADVQAILYRDPKGTPITITSINLDPNTSPSTGHHARQLPLQNMVTMTVSTTYLLALKGMSTSACTVRLMEFANSAFIEALGFGSSLGKGARGGGAGAFSMVDTVVPLGYGVRINKIAAGGATTVTVTTTTTITTAQGIKIHPGMTGGANG